MSGNTKYDPVELALESERERLRRLQEKTDGIFYGGWVTVGQRSNNSKGSSLKAHKPSNKKR